MSKKAPKTEAQDAAPETGAQTEAPKHAAPKAKLTPIRKITVKEVHGIVALKDLPPLRINVTNENPEGEPNADCEVRIARFAGYASGVKRGNGTYGEWAALVGEFAATSYATGEMFAAKHCIVPGAMGDALVTATENTLSENADAKVRFSVDVSVKRSARDPGKKYEFVVRPVIDSELSSPAMELLSFAG